MKDKTLGIIGGALTIGGAIIGLVAGKIKDEQNKNAMDKKITEEVAKALAHMKKSE